jgi:hypothetical protein
VNGGHTGLEYVQAADYSDTKTCGSELARDDAVSVVSFDD